jgi:hypothetical protein
MSTIKIRAIEGRRVRDPKHPKRAALKTGDTLDVSEHDIFWTRRLRDGDVELVHDEAPSKPVRTPAPQAQANGAKE